MRGVIAKRLRKVAKLVFIKDVRPEWEKLAAKVAAGELSEEDGIAQARQLPGLRTIYKRLKRSYVKGY